MLRPVFATLALIHATQQNGPHVRWIGTACPPLLIRPVAPLPAVKVSSLWALRPDPPQRFPENTSGNKPSVKPAGYPGR